MQTVTSYIGLGSNLSDPVNQLQQALSAIHLLENTEVKQCSALYASKPMGPQEQPDYVNAVAQIETQLSPTDLLVNLQQIEAKHGRERKAERWGPRTLDLDIILFGNEQIQSDDLIVPHYGMKVREFVLYPLHEIAPDLVLPCGNTLVSILHNVPTNGLVVVKEKVFWE
ncbi:2-amino-4-hydroxy-6-hydroxymethyldihydropteridine diphosphokinase [Aliiglaciecola lipolytica]|uniref:2-amino-4-hydroxy-6-hydroxymethyldihydropteridine pyrophosphokinase n=1 Tax=Aliiglaciecola lipolytica E3 TaxID=1127673 RepID=K6YJ47_9ALTE|nr:2-amino-4-hydroxy-6-hydroxymethyldihydropteridine diphosphokinase [Aliiglaciecola lipolytica]GAC16643.1 2-amino-4-hydroxy-6-hydroxymethyldihydropteridine diphosphokinase [Aliiglaciecola lipolytica E3]